VKSTQARKLFGTISVALALVLIAAIPARAASVPTWTVIDTINPGPDDSSALDLGNSFAFKGYVYFAASTDALGRELWRSNGTTTELVKDINGENAGMDDSNPAQFGFLGNWLYFRADDGVHGRELWRTDGTAANTTMVKDINSGSENSGPANLTAFGGLLYFSATDAAHGNEIWKTDGTAAGTTLVADINLLDGGAQSSGPYNLKVFNNLLYFAAADGVHGYELWKTDGTAGQTSLVKDIFEGPELSGPESLTVYNGALYFSADDGVHGYELWKTDGTAAQTSLVKDIRVGIQSSNPESITVHNGALYFSADDGVHGNELWKSGGTAANTVMVMDINPNNVGADSSTPDWFTVLGQTLFFAADDGTNGRELWRTDGTEVNTSRVTDIDPSDSSFPEQLVPLGDFVYFNAISTSGKGVWRTDGITTEAVPFPLAGQVNDCDCRDTALIAVGGRLFSTVNSDEIGHEFAYLDETSYVLPSTDREASGWTVSLVILTGLTAAASIGLRVREAKRA
jgi:ELWxxDGT repeat protein